MVISLGVIAPQGSLSLHTVGVHFCQEQYMYSSKEVWKSNFRQYGEMKKQSAGRRVRREKIRRKKMQVREKVGESRNTVFFSWFCGSGGLKSRLAKSGGCGASWPGER